METKSIVNFSFFGSWNENFVIENCNNVLSVDTTIESKEKAKKGARAEPLVCSSLLQDQTESAAILKIKESMQEEAKRFEADSDHPDYFIQWKI